MSEEEFTIYRSTNKTKMPDDGLVEYECARFRVSGDDFGIIHLSEINRWMAISPAIQFEIFKTEKEALKMAESWKRRMQNALTAEIERNETDEFPTVPNEYKDLLEKIKTFVPSRHPGRLPTVSVLDPEGGVWCSSSARSVSAIQPIFVRGVDFSQQPPILEYQIPEGTEDEYIPSFDAATHIFFYAGLEDVGSVLSVPIRAKEKSGPTLALEGDIPLNDLALADFVMGNIIDEGMWKDRDQHPFVLALGACNSLVLARRVEQIESLLESDFFVKFEN